MDRNAEAVLTFNKHANAYNERFGNLDLYNDTYDLFSSLIPSRHSSILDVGCGPGNITNYLLRKRPDLKITGVDLAPNMIELARENNPSAKFEVMDCRNISSLQAQYDAIVCGFTIPYLSKEETHKLIGDCSKLIRKEGILYFSLIEGRYENSGYQYASNGVDRSFVYYYNSVKILSLIEQCDLRLVQNMDFRWERHDGTPETHLVFIAMK